MIKPKKIREREDAIVASSSKERVLRKMVLSKKAKIRWEKDPDQPRLYSRRWDGRRAVLELSRENNVYVTPNIDITPGADALTEICVEYNNLLSTLKEINKTCAFLPVNPSHHRQSYSGTRQYPNQNVSADDTLHCNIEDLGETCSVWATDRLSFGGDFEMMMNHTD